ncbi:MAG: protein of unknown function containing DUF4381 domain [Idiomarinaceae bacterium HL-53]|nr:MAG: protein of unknown function containing DUF4381 domain [Idiomarinaceae bacterium HL-53]CUS49369.1 protein of unknown function (DUF4381) [Idiomarinaceae bacterium HL-53]
MTNPLAQLNDIEEIQQVAWWPLGWGWWLLLALVIIIVVSIALYAARRRRDRRVLHTCIQQVRDQAQHMRDISTALKIAALHYLPSQTPSGATYAAISGLELLTLLNTQLPENKQFSASQLNAIASAQYSPSAQEQFNSFREFALRWLTHACPRRPEHV